MSNLTGLTPEEVSRVVSIMNKVLFLLHANKTTLSIALLRSLVEFMDSSSFENVSEDSDQYTIEYR